MSNSSNAEGARQAFEQRYNPGSLYGSGHSQRDVLIGMSGLVVKEASNRRNEPVEVVEVDGNALALEKDLREIARLEEAQRGKQQGGSHYAKLRIKPFTYAQLNGLDYPQAEVVKYVTRFRQKGGATDLKKAIHTLQVMLAHEYPEEAR